MENKIIDQSDYIESASYLEGSSDLMGGSCRKPCKSCGGGCYGCKRSKSTEISSEGREFGLAEIVESVLE